MIKFVAIAGIVYLVFVLVGYLMASRLLSIVDYWYSIRPNRVTAILVDFTERVVILWFILGLPPLLWLIQVIQDTPFVFQNTIKPWLKRQWSELRDWWTL